MASDTADRTVGLPASSKTMAAMLLCVLMTLTLPAALADENVALSAQPRLCVIAPGDQLCSLQLRLSWSADRDRDVCLRLSEQTEFLHCWQAQQQGEYTVELAHDDNITVQLQDAQTGRILGQLDIPVIKRDLRDTRRRRRHAWSIF